jgi:hypothetical protein
MFGRNESIIYAIGLNSQFSQWFLTMINDKGAISSPTNSNAVTD